ncbi:Hsp20/alpha crystallin family protein [Alicyclobacillus tolerans]|uniref:Hsp20/alpha crystallin family protein n=1 Tax=Alicyclobacillus tolerans TaxID=90970 RepID=UPI001F301BE7|nr:Hsp20/alpha crystallin family protein [Alicyclobacillus tolerans]MCF8563747.1 Hsp20/alpha crystallin family protein [Alicyclobacillus tolerans]
MANNKDKGPTNPFDMFRNMGDLKDVKKILGEDFFKNLPFPNMQGGSFFDDSSDEDEFPSVDLYDRGHEVIAVLELPGLQSPTDVSLFVGSTYLRVKGQIGSEIPSREAQIVLSERHHGPFEREIELPDRVVPDKVRASYRNGLLIVSLTKQAVHEGPNDVIPIDFG